MTQTRWEAEMASTFGLLQPGLHPTGSEPVTGSLRSSALGRACVFDVRGDPQVLRRTPASIRREPRDPLKVCIQRAGTVTLHQGGAEVRIGPGEMAIYDTGRPYDLLLEGSWSTVDRRVRRRTDRQHGDTDSSIRRTGAFVGQLLTFRAPFARASTEC